MTAAMRVIFAAPREWRLWVPLVVPLIVLRILDDGDEREASPPTAVGAWGQRG